MKRFWTSRAFIAVLISGGAGGLLVVFWLLPWLARENDEEWLIQHSEWARWEHIQNRIRRLAWVHDDFSAVGAFGDKSWAAWIMERLAEEEDPRECASGHKVSALENITNFAPDRHGKPWRDVLPQWQAWWRANGGRTQDEWIVSGFAAAGVTIHNPPESADWPALLTVLAPSGRKPDKNDPRPAPSHLYYNAFRCLRDSGFNSVKYALESPLTPDIRAGLEAYHRRETTPSFWGARPGAVFAERNRDGLFGFVPYYREPAFLWGWGSASTVAVGSGLCLWRRKWKGTLKGC